MVASIIPPTPDSARRSALTDLSNLGGARKATTKTPFAKKQLTTSSIATPEVYYDASETPRVTPSEGEFHITPAKPAEPRPKTPELHTPDERLLTNAAAEEALTAAWIAAQTAEIEALRALVQRQRTEKESLISVGAAPYAEAVQRVARGRLVRARKAAFLRGILVAQTRARGCLLYTSPSPRDKRQSRMPSSA